MINKNTQVDVQYLISQIFCCDPCLEGIPVRELSSSQLEKNKVIFVKNRAVDLYNRFKINIDVRGEPRSASSTNDIANRILQYTDKIFNIDGYEMELFVNDFISNGVDNYNRVSMSSVIVMSIY